MEMKDTRIIAADRVTVWAALNDPEVLALCIPGCEELTGSPEEGFEAVVKQKIGPVRATFKGSVEISDVVEGESYHISGKGKGGMAGFASGAAEVSLVDTPEGCALSYDVSVKVGGKIAQLGSRLIDSFARKLADAFFEKFQTEVEKLGQA